MGIKSDIIGRQSALVLSGLACVAVLVACQPNASRSPSTAPSSAAEAPTSSAPVASQVALSPFVQALTTSGVTLVFDRCDLEDKSRWQGAEDELGAFVCGEAYALRYDPASGEWVLSGPAEVEGFDPNNFVPRTRGTAGPAPTEGIAMLWGGRYRFDENGLVYRRSEVEPLGRMTVAQ